MMWNKNFDGTKYSRKDNFLRLIDKLCDSLEIRHQLIRTRTHRHKGKLRETIEMIMKDFIVMRI